MLKLTFVPTRAVQPRGHEPVTHAVRGRPGPTDLCAPDGCCPGRVDGPPIPQESGETSNRVIGGAEGGALAGPFRAGRTPARDGLGTVDEALSSRRELSCRRSGREGLLLKPVALVAGPARSKRVISLFSTTFRG